MVSDNFVDDNPSPLPTLIYIYKKGHLDRGKEEFSTGESLESFVIRGTSLWPGSVRTIQKAEARQHAEYIHFFVLFDIFYEICVSNYYIFLAEKNPIRSVYNGVSRAVYVRSITSAEITNVRICMVIGIDLFCKKLNLSTSIEINYLVLN